MKFNKIYPLLLNKCLRKGRSEQEVIELINWLFGYDKNDIDNMMMDDISYEGFILNAPKKNPNRLKVKGSICKVKIEEIKDPTYKDIRILDKLIDELAKGKELAKIFSKYEV